MISILLELLPILKLVVLPLNNIEKAFVALLVAKVNVVCGVVTLLLIAPIVNVLPVCILMMNRDLKDLLLIID